MVGISSGSTLSRASSMVSSHFCLRWRFACPPLHARIPLCRCSSFNVMPTCFNLLFTNLFLICFLFSPPRLRRLSRRASHCPLLCSMFLITYGSIAALFSFNSSILTFIRLSVLFWYSFGCQFYSVIHSVASLFWLHSVISSILIFIRLSVLFSTLNSAAASSPPRPIVGIEALAFTPWFLPVSRSSPVVLSGGILPTALASFEFLFMSDNLSQFLSTLNSIPSFNVHSFERIRSSSFIWFVHLILKFSFISFVRISIYVGQSPLSVLVCY